MLGNMHGRAGDAGPDRSAWARAIYTDLDVRQAGGAAPQSRGHVGGVQVGADLLAGGNWRFGVYVGSLDGSADVSGNANGTFGRVGTTDLQSRYLAGYANWRDAASGWYVEAVLQAGHHRYNARPDGSLPVSGKARSVSASVEAGKSFALSESWSIEPQVQLIRQRTRVDDVSINGALVQQHADGGWIGRLGVRIKGDMPTGAGRLQPYARFNVYRASSGADVVDFVAPAAANRVDQRQRLHRDRSGGWTLAGADAGDHGIRRDRPHLQRGRRRPGEVIGAGDDRPARDLVAVQARGAWGRAVAQPRSGGTLSPFWRSRNSAARIRKMVVTGALRATKNAISTACRKRCAPWTEK